MSEFGHYAPTLDRNPGKGRAVIARRPRSLAVALAAILTAVVALAHPSAAQAHPLQNYNCGNGVLGPDSSNTIRSWCNAMATLDTSFYQGATGVTTKIQMVQLQCQPLFCDPPDPGFIDNVVYLYGSTYVTWVESGYWAYSDASTTYQSYFWADKRPQDTLLNFHNAATVPIGDYGTSPNFSINWAGSNDFHVRIHSANYLLDADSTNNGMGVTSVYMGMELSGVAGASAPAARFSYRYVLTSLGQAAINGDYAREWTNGAPPPDINIYTSDPGQDPYTSCC